MTPMEDNAREQTFRVLGEIRTILLRLPAAIDLVQAQVLLGNRDTAIELLTLMRHSLLDLNQATGTVIESITPKE